MTGNKVINRPRVCVRGLDVDGINTCNSIALRPRGRGREEIAKARERRMRNIMRKLPSPQRKFALAVRHVLEAVPGPQDLQREKIMKRLKIGRAMYFRMLGKVDKTLV